MFIFFGSVLKRSKSYLFMICVVFYMYVVLYKMCESKRGRVGIIIQSNNLSAETGAAALWA